MSADLAASAAAGEATGAASVGEGGVRGRVQDCRDAQTCAGAAHPARGLQLWCVLFPWILQQERIFSNLGRMIIVPEITVGERRRDDGRSFQQH